MRKTLALLLAAVLPLIGAAAVLGAQLVLRDREDAVTVEEEVLFGTPEAAGNLQAVVGTYCGDNLSWQTRFSPGETEEADVRFAFVDEFTYKWDWSSDRLFVVDFCSADFGMSWYDRAEDQAWWENLEQSRYLYLPAKDVADRTGPGEVRTETLDLSDYYDIYPLCLSVDSMALEAYFSDAISGTEKITEVFSFPVLPGTMVEVTVSRDEAGTLSSINSSGSSYFPSITAAYADKNCAYLYFDETPDLDTSEIAGGYGIYRVDYHPEDTTVFYTSDSYAVYSDALSIDRISTVLPVEGTIRQVLPVNDGRQLLVLWERSGMLHLSVLERGSDRLLQQLDLLPVTADLGLGETEFFGDALLLRLCDGTVAVVAPGEDGYEMVLSASLTDAALAPYFSDGARSEQARWDGSVAAYDGERLALLYRLDITVISQLGLLVLNTDGTPAFAARYYHSGNDDRGGIPPVVFDDPNWPHEEQLPMTLSFS